MNSAKIYTLIMDSRKESPVVTLLRALPPALIGVMIFQIAAAVGFLMLGMVAAGLYIDSHFGTRPVLTLLLALAGALLSVWLTFRIALRTSAKAHDVYQAHLAAGRTGRHTPGPQLDTRSVTQPYDSWAHAPPPDHS